MNTTLHLKPQPDGFGFIYGTVSDANGQSVRVDIMPPLSEWRGHIRMTGANAPHEHDWVIYLDGSEVARVRQRTDIEAAVDSQIGSHRGVR